MMRRVVPFDPARVLFEDDDLLVVDKPAFVPSQATEEGAHDDLVARLRALLVGRGVDPYLGVHQRLDAGTSGVILFVRRKSANGAIARQFEGRTVGKVYLAAVTLRAKLPEVLRDHLVVKDGTSRVVPKGTRGAQLAVTRARVLERVGDRALLRLELETGRMHQARAQLAHHGAPIAGDPLYGGAPAARLMLHAHELEVAHPTSGRPTTFRAPAPADLADWVRRGELGDAVYGDPAALSASLAAALERRYGLATSEETTAFRLVNEAGDALPGVAIDVYGEHAVVQIYGTDGPLGDEAARERLLDAVAALGFAGVYLKVRPKQANVVVDAAARGLTPPEAVRGANAADPLVIREEGVPLWVRLGDGLSTGLFLDQRRNRRLVRSLARGARVANLFAYTSAFSVFAALGGARSTVSVDASAGVLVRGKENLTLAMPDHDHDAHAFVCEDVFAWMRRQKPGSFDLVVLDPPSYATTKKTRFVADSDYGDLAARAIRMLAPGGRLLACTNHRKIGLPRFRHTLLGAVRAEKRPLAQLKDLPEPVDYPYPIGGACHLKAVLVTLG